jgi:cell division protease FtsH
MKTILFWFLMPWTAVLLYNVVQRTPFRSAQTIAFSRFLQEVERSNVAEVTIADSDIKGHLKSGETFKTVVPTYYPPLIDLLWDKQVVISGERAGNSPRFPALISWAPFLLQIGFWIFFMRPVAERLGLPSRTGDER